MKIKADLKYFLFSLAFVFAVRCLNAQSRPSLKLPAAFITRQLEDATSQYKFLISQMPDKGFARTFENDSLHTAASWSWISGFYPGVLLYLYEFNNDDVLLKEAKNRMAQLEREKKNKKTHDLGFMLYCSFGNAYRLTGDPAYKEILLAGAESLISRYNPTVGCIRSWDNTQGGKWKFPVIIDNMMNLEYLNWASRVSGNDIYLNISKKHANTTLKNHFRPDYSSYHVVDYDPGTGAVRIKQTHQGAHDESAWARGQAWALYGYTMMYRDTKDKAYLDIARKVAQYIINNPAIPENKIPYWDYSASGPDAPRDASAAAVTSSALLELSGMVTKKEGKQYIEYAEAVLKSLAAQPYKAAKGTNGGFLLKHSTGNFPQRREIDVPLSYADYYYVETLIRYKTLLEKGTL